MSGAALEVSGLGARQGGREVLRGVDLSLEAGARLAVIGRSGAGKTTLLRALAGLTAPSGGSVRLGGATVHDAGGERVAPERRRVGFLFQGLASWTHLGVGAALRLAGCPPGEVPTLAARFGLASRLDARPDQLSGGEQQRLALARALAGRPALLLLDEPFAHQDAPLRQALLQDLLAALERERPTVILVTHQARDVWELGEQVLVLRGGEAVEQGPLARVAEAPRAAETALLLEHGDVVAGVVRAGRLETPLGALALVAPAPSEGQELRGWLAPGSVRARPDPTGSARVLRPAWERGASGDGTPHRVTVAGLGLEAWAEGPLAPGTPVSLEVRRPVRALDVGG